MIAGQVVSHPGLNEVVKTNQVGWSTRNPEEETLSSISTTKTLFSYTRIDIFAKQNLTLSSFQADQDIKSWEESFRAMAFGPKKVILVVGMNKVTPDLESAMARVRHNAAPVNVIRIGYQNPCGETGLCSDCRSPQRSCNIWSIIEGHRAKGRIHVKLVGESLGY
jgi:hypothetical protein